MSDAARMMKANKPMEGKICGWCSVSLVLGDDAAVCQACGNPHHARCWDLNRGCSGQGCLNAPLEELKAPPAQKPAPPTGKKECPKCRKLISEASDVCVFCKTIVSPDGLYHGPKTNAPGAVDSLVWGIVGFFCCGIITGSIAIVQANKAMRAIAEDPRLEGQGLATAGKILGIIALILNVLGILLYIMILSMHRR